MKRIPRKRGKWHFLDPNNKNFLGDISSNTAKAWLSLATQAQAQTRLGMIQALENETRRKHKHKKPF